MSRLRAALAVIATERIGLEVTEVDLRVTDLLDIEPAAERAGAGGTADLAGGTTEPAGVAATAGASVTPGAAQHAGDVAARAPGVMDTSEGGGGSEADRVAGVVLEVPGVSRLTGVWGRPVRLGEQARPPGTPCRAATRAWISPSRRGSARWRWRGPCGPRWRPWGRTGRRWPSWSPTWTDPAPSAGQGPPVYSPR